MAVKKNLLSKISTWVSGVTNLTIISDYEATWKATTEGAYISVKFSAAELTGKTLKFGFDDYAVGDNQGWAYIREEYADGTNKVLAEFKSGTTVPFAADILISGTAKYLKIYLRHDWASAGYPETLFHIKNIYLYDTSAGDSGTMLNFHKILEQNLPKNVPVGTEHVYFTTDGTNVKMLINNKEGYLIPVGSPSAGGGTGEVVKYDNAFTRGWINERKAEILNLLKQGDCISFVILTDIHVQIEDGDAGRYNQVRDALMVVDALPIDYICCCGDIMSYCQDWDGNVEPRIDKIRNILSEAKIPWFATRGNHDYNSDDYNTGGNPNIKEFDKTTMNNLFITNRDWFKSIGSKHKPTSNIDIVFDKDRSTYGYFYVDDYSLKHRMIFLNSEETHETALGRPYANAAGEPDCFVSGTAETKHQLEWLLQYALDMNTKKDWVVSFYTHTAPYTDVGEPAPLEFHGYGGNNPDIRTIIKAFRTGGSVDNLKYGVLNVDNHQWIESTITKSFVAQGPINVIGWFSGHIHDDCYKKVDGLNIMVSTCTCASRRTTWSRDPNPTKLPPDRNTSNYSMSMNVVVVNKSTKKVNIVKLGSKRDNAIKTSSDIEFSY